MDELASLMGISSHNVSDSAGCNLKYLIILLVNYTSIKLEKMLWVCACPQIQNNLLRFYFWLFGG